MIKQLCKNCELSKSFDDCKKADCFEHDSFYARGLEQKLSRIKQRLEEKQEHNFSYDIKSILDEEFGCETN